MEHNSAQLNPNLGMLEMLETCCTNQRPHKGSMWGEFDLSEPSITKPHRAQICSCYKQVDLVGDAVDMLHHLNTPDMLHQLNTPQKVDVG